MVFMYAPRKFAENGEKLTAQVTETGLPERTLADDHVAMLRGLAEVLERHEMLGIASLLIGERISPTDQTTIYTRVTRPDGVIELHPHSLEELSEDDLLFLVTHLDPGDEEFMDYVNSPRAGHGNCQTRQKKGEAQRHFYDTGGRKCNTHQKKDGTKQHNY